MTFTKWINKLLRNELTNYYGMLSNYHSTVRIENFVVCNFMAEK